MSDALDEVALARRQHWVNQVARHAVERADHAALVCEGRRTSWAELQDRVVALSGALARRGVAAGDRVAILMGNRSEYVEQLVAVNRLGAIAVPLNFRLSPGEVAYVLEDSGARLVFVDDGTAATGREAVAQTSHAVTVVDGAAYDALLVEPGEPAPLVDVAEEQPALIMYTSGTTGRPKGAVLTHRNLAAQSATLLMAFGFRLDGEVSMCASPLFHIGAIGSVAPALMVGATQVIVPTGAFDAAGVLAVMERERVTSVFLVPTQWQAVVDEQLRAPRDLSALRVAGWGAAPATDTLLRQMGEVLVGADNVALFGQTEMSPVTCVLEGRDARRKLGSVGRPVPGVQARVVRPDLTDVEPGEVGEIVYRGPGTMLGYWNNPEATAEAFAGGWFHSGDLVRVDDEGFVHVVDRAKDMIISGGENIYCAEVENVLAGHPGVAEVSVIGRPHERWGETPVAVVVPRAGAALDLEEVRTWASDQLARYKLPTVLEVVTELPRNASGKVTKGALRDRFGHAP
ncbi:long-chain-fatty-acid--CoA ligase [Nocardioides sp. YIM 152315]|uniref:long-chain-fatty-acid--CoA ligase n=1 Tax=Nocardioides sp. YIM 152315 TaxID=3031760 RepID=UPI0023DA83BF|nr:long-chain-fatty-acid--CoA ligase [Nocardioides sp. YIM 152315]MDF1602133.1 long-chain-fatty-acid--CoA ligase [Nocardioides sp. YIM 152315]